MLWQFEFAVNHDFLMLDEDKVVFYFFLSQSSGTLLCISFVYCSVMNLFIQSHHFF